MTSGYKTGTKKHKIKAKLAIATLQAMIIPNFDRVDPAKRKGPSRQLQ